MRNHHSALVQLLLLVACVLSFQAMAQQTWRRCYGGPGADEASSVIESSAGGFLVLGTTGSFGNGSSDMYLMRLSEAGAPIWSHAYGGAGIDVSTTAIESASGWLLGGTSSQGLSGAYDITLLCLGEDGEVLWQRFYGGQDWDLCHGVIALTDGYLLFGHSFSEQAPQGQGIAIRTDSEGHAVWEYRFDSPNASVFNGAALHSNGTISLVGSTETDEGDLDGILLAISEGGELQWSLHRGGADDDWFSAIAIDQQDRLMVLGSTKSGAAVQRIWFNAFQANGDFSWERFYGNTSDAGGTALQLAHGQGFVLTGYNTLNGGDRDMIFTLLSDDGWFQTGFNYGDGRPADGRSIASTSDGGYVVAGWIEEIGPGPRSMYVVKCDAQGLTASVDVECFSDPLPVEEMAIGVGVSLAPNPVVAGEAFRLDGDFSGIRSVSVLDAVGREVPFAMDRSSAIAISLPEQCSGLYYCVITSVSSSRTIIPFLIISD